MLETWSRKRLLGASNSRPDDLPPTSRPLLPPGHAAHQALPAGGPALPAGRLPTLLQGGHPLAGPRQLPLQAPQGCVHLVQREGESLKLGSTTALVWPHLGLGGLHCVGCCAAGGSCWMRGLQDRVRYRQARESVKFSREFRHLRSQKG